MEKMNSPAQKESMPQNGKARNQKREENGIQIGNYFVMKQRQKSLKRLWQVMSKPLFVLLRRRALTDRKTFKITRARTIPMKATMLCSFGSIYY